jgi:hypothetical protein
MSKPFDATTKRMVALDPAAWLRLLGPLPPGVSARQVELLDVDLSTVTAAADCILRVGRRRDLPLRHVEFESNPKDWLPRRSAFYNALIGYKTGQAVRTSLLLLRPEARNRRFTGVYAEADGAGEEWFRFRYDVVRLYELDPEVFLSGPLAVLPLATLCRVPAGRFTRVVREVETRLLTEAPEPLGRDLYAASYILAGLSHPRRLVNTLMKGLPGMRESSTYRHILEEGREQGIQQGIQRGIEQGIEEGIQRGIERGRAAEARNLLLYAGTSRFGEPDEAARRRIEAVTSADELEAVFRRVFAVESWMELLSGLPESRG